MPTLGFRFRAYADEQTLRALKAQLKLACKIYNTLRWADIYFYQRDGKGLTQTELRQLALDLRKQDDEYKQLYSQVVQQIADRYYEAKKRFFEGLARFPKEKKPHKHYSLVYTQSGWKILHVREIRKGKKKLITLKLSNLGTFKVIIHRDFPLDKVKRVIVKLTRSERIYITFVVDHEFPKLPNTGKEVAIDVGVEKLLVTSDGEYFPNLRPLEKALWKVKHLHRELSRKKFLSHNWFKAKVKLARAYEHLKNLRTDLYMKLGKWFAEHYDVVVMEGIHAKQLVGKSLRSLRRRLSDVGFGELRDVLKYQLEKYGKKLILVNPAYTSKTCARCGYVKNDLSLSDRVFVCPNCGWIADRDYNASLNILKSAGSERSLVPVELRPLPVLWHGRAVKQEAPSFMRG
ncbi:transposase [Saccharolobus solfataricus]|uniref:Transposase n=2 Tax=Saccharolobus solfataricus TaxID=2287 RepID=A0A0E3MBE5_SACSO|nr:RNA-guided endonuclease TnpB family protein [Saccharolobus solfataricus]AKA74915.1 transposase [Saccharolobus solfataricus]AKA77611.1 transposase [Saccharolobus solfataricus]AKA80302.1 transposase [Saccharolobus solfataricus]AZF69381.1 transposase [Saccharolobus solfataricus]AZF72001.1 transposase [Saccharolobus solfataricus]